MNKKQFGCILALLIVLLCGSVFFNFILLAMHGLRGVGPLMAERAPKFGETTVQDGHGAGKIAQIELRGVIIELRRRHAGRDDGR